MNHSFHGRTMGALSVTGTPKYREPFEPMIGHVKFAELNNFDTVKAQVTDKRKWCRDPLRRGNLPPHAPSSERLPQEPTGLWETLSTGAWRRG